MPLNVKIAFVGEGEGGSSGGLVHQRAPFAKVYLPFSNDQTLISQATPSRALLSPPWLLTNSEAVHHWRRKGHSMKTELETDRLCESGNISSRIVDTRHKIYFYHRKTTLSGLQV